MRGSRYLMATPVRATDSRVYQFEARTNSDAGSLSLPGTAFLRSNQGNRDVRRSKRGRADKRGPAGSNQQQWEGDVENPTVSLADLRKLYSVSHHDMWKAQAMFHVRRKTGRGSKAYRKEQNQ
jgi:hypothetical protein